MLRLSLFLFSIAILFTDSVNGQRASHTGVRLRLKSLTIREDTLFLNLTLRNHSLVPYRISSIDLFSRDRHHSRRTAVQQQAYDPLVEPPLFPVLADSTLSIAIPYESFALSKDKMLYIEISESPGERTLQLRLKGKEFMQKLSKQ